MKAIFNACLSARSRVLRFKSNIDPRDIVAYCSDQAHSTAARAAGMSLMKIRERFQNNYFFSRTCFKTDFEILNPRKIKSDELGRMNGENLVKQMRNDIESGLIPAFVAATLGTTGLCEGLFTHIKLSGKEALIRSNEAF